MSTPPTVAALAADYLRSVKVDKISKKEKEVESQILAFMRGNEGAYNILYLLAKALQLRSRFADARDSERHLLQIVALRIFTILESIEEKDFLLKGLTQDLVLHHAIALAELRFKNAAVSLAKKALTESPSDVSA